MQYYVLFSIFTVLLISGGTNYLIVNADRVSQDSYPTITFVQSNITGPVKESNGTLSSTDDSTNPIVNIVEPGWCSDVKAGNVLVRGTFN